MCNFISILTFNSLSSSIAIGILEILICSQKRNAQCLKFSMYDLFVLHLCLASLIETGGNCLNIWDLIRHRNKLTSINPTSFFIIPQNVVVQFETAVSLVS